MARVSFCTPEPFPAPSAKDAPSAEQILARAQERAEELSAMQALRAPWRRPVLEAGPALVDIDAAVTCLCSCHPQPPSFSLHDGGPACLCQLSPEERTARRDEAFQAIRKLSEDLTLARDTSARDELARSLGVEVLECGGLAPFVIRGVVDGRFFYLRERHDEYRVVMAPAADPLRDVWKDYQSPAVLVARGVADDFLAGGVFSEAQALRIAVLAVRVALRRSACAHGSSSGEWFCSHCGAQLPAAGLPDPD